MLNDIKIRRIELDDKETLKKIYKLRVICRQDEGYITFDKFPDGWFDDEDKSAFHFAVFNDNKLIASARINFYNSLREHPYFPAFDKVNIIKQESQIGYLSKVVVLPTFRRNNISKLLVRERECFSIKKNIKAFYADVCGFQVNNFKKYGYRQIERFDTTKIKWDLGSEQYLMYKQL